MWQYVLEERYLRRNPLGFAAEASFDDIIRAHIEDEMGGKIEG